MAVPGAVTDPQAVSTSRVQLSSGGDLIDAYVARAATGIGGADAPAGRRAGTNGGIIVIHEAFGPVEHIDDLARRFANAGFDAIAPNLYSRAGAPDPNDMGSVMTKMFGVTDAQVVADLEAAAAHLRSLAGANGKVGVIGFCSGGRQTLLVACSSPAVDAAVACWGGFIERATPDATVTEARPTPVIDLVENLGCPLYVVGGAEDQNPSPAVLADLEGRLRKAGKDATVEVFDDAGHAFLADYRPSYREGPAHALWPKIIDFFRRKLA